MDLADTGAQRIVTALDESTHTSRLVDNGHFWDTQLRLLPRGGDATAPICRYHEAIYEIEAPNPEYFVDRTCYRLVAGPRKRKEHTQLTLQSARYFDYLDVGELLCHEFADWMLQHDLSESPPGPHELANALPCRVAAAEWSGLDYRESIVGVNNLTVVSDDTSRTFLMMERGAHLGSAKGAIHVVPAGEFQPSQDSPIEIRRQCTLWQTLIREFSEELLMCDEARFNTKPLIALAKIEPIPHLLRAIRSGSWRTWYLGTALDPLTLKPEIMLVTVISKSTFKSLLRLANLDEAHPPAQNGEGFLYHGDDGWGDPLLEEHLLAYANDMRTLPAAAGCAYLVSKNIDLFVL